MQQLIQESDMIPAIVQRLDSDNGEPYYIRLSVDNPGGFVRGLWGAISGDTHGNPVSDEDSCRELTDRMRCYRVRVSNGEVVIHTHAWHPSGDKNALHADVLRYLRGVGFTI